MEGAHRSARTAALVCSLLTVACGEPGGGPDPTPPASLETAPAEGETLLLSAPPAWLRTRAEANEKFRLVEYLPAGHSEADWEERLVVESNALQPLPDPITFLDELGANDSKNCTFAKSQNVFAGFENGYPSAVHLFTCREDKDTGRGRVQLIKAIQGREHFYVIERTRRSAPLSTDSAPLSNQDMAAWSLYFRSVKLCDTRSSAHPCPADPSDTSAEV